MRAIAIFQNGSGYIEFEQKTPTDLLTMNINLSGFKSYSTHAIHIHEFGDFSDGCKSLGGHFNPTNKRHSHSELGHAGDLFNNFVTDNNGQFIATFKTNKLSLYPNKLCIIGRSVVIHKFPDDYGITESYHNMSAKQLLSICNKLGYEFNKKITRNVLLDKLTIESQTTGNASTRIDCAIIGLKKS